MRDGDRLLIVPAATGPTACVTFWSLRSGECFYLGNSCGESIPKEPVEALPTLNKSRSGSKPG
jgi:hypothetical protein